MMRTAISPRLATSTFVTRRACTASRFAATSGLGIPSGLALFEEGVEALLALVGPAQAGNGACRVFLHLVELRPGDTVDELFGGGDRLGAGFQEAVHPALDGEIYFGDVRYFIDLSLIHISEPTRQA